MRMTYAQLFELGENMMLAWNAYCASGTVIARMAYEKACDIYEAAERECDALPTDHIIGTNIAG